MRPRAGRASEPVVSAGEIGLRRVTKKAGKGLRALPVSTPLRRLRGAGAVSLATGIARLSLGFISPAYFSAGALNVVAINSEPPHGALPVRLASSRSATEDATQQDGHGRPLRRGSGVEKVI